MPYNYDVAVKGIERTILDMQKRQDRQAEIDDALKVYQGKTDIDTKAAANDPMQLLMMREYIKQNPEAGDILGQVLGIQPPVKGGVEANAKADPATPVRSQPLTRPTVDMGRGRQITGQAEDPSQFPVAEGSAPVSNEPDVFSMKTEPDILLDKSGKFVSKTPSHKDFIFKKIQEKEQRGVPLSANERSFRNRYLGINEKKKGPETPEERLKVRDLAKEMAKDAARSTMPPDQQPGFDIEDYVPSEEQIALFFPDALKYLYPSADVNKVATQKYDIKLPGNITKASQALQYLLKQGLSEDEARAWIMKRN